MNHRRAKSLSYALMGHLYEHYNGSLFNFAVPLLGPLFFVNQRWAHGAVAAGFIMQPFGAFIFSWIGDRIGRRPAIIYAFFLSSVPTIVMGLLPTYAEWGIWSSILLIACRIVQGASIGGAFYGTVTFVGETSKRRDRNLNMGLLLPMGFIGVILGMLFFRAILGSWPEHGWRLPFLAGGLMGFVLYGLRRFLVESAAWEATVFQEDDRIPFWQVCKKYPANVFAVLFAGMGGFVPFYLVAGWLPALLMKHYDLSTEQMLNLSIAMMALGGFFAFLSCWISSFLNLRKMLKIYIVLWIPLGILLYLGLVTHNLFYIITAQLLIAVNTGLCLCVFLLIQKLFPLQYSYSGFAVPYACGQALLMGTTPLLAGLIKDYTGNPQSACVLMIISTVLMGAVLYLPKPVTEDDA